MSENFDTNQNHYYFNKKNSVHIVFIHGVGLDHQMWNEQVNYLNEFSILTYDLLGHGKTPYNKDKLSFRFVEPFSEANNVITVNAKLPASIFIKIQLT